MDRDLSIQDPRPETVSGEQETLRPPELPGPSPESPARWLLRGSDAGGTLGPYRLLDLLGEGGMGEVWRAEDGRLGRQVALKLLPPELARSPQSNARFLQEARAASSLDHPNICTIYEVGETADHRLYLAMPCYPGEPLRERIARGPLPLAEALHIALQTARGLSEAHRKGIVHRDIKPANLMLTADGTVKILDFGIAKLAGQDGLTRAGMVLGTLSYMSPEQLRGEPVDAATDLWSLGVVLYEMLAGRHPFPGEAPVVIREAILHAEPEPLARLRPEVPAAVRRLVAALLSKDPAARPAAATGVEALLAKATGEATAGRPPALASGRRLATGLIALALILAGALALTRRQEAPHPRNGGAPLARALASPIPPAPSGGERRPSVAVLGFQDLSGDPSRQWLGPALTEMLTAELAAGGKFRVVSSESTARARHSLGAGGKESLDQAYVGRLHALVGADLAVAGTYLPLGEEGHRRLRLDLRILTMPAGDTVASVVESGTEPELFDLVARTGSKLRNALGLSLPTDTERRQVRGLLPAGADAMHLYAEALAHLRSYDPAGARDLLLRAESLEPSSVVIQSALSEAWMMLGQDAKASQAALRAYNGRQSLPQETQLTIEARFYEAGKKWERASAIYHSLQTLFPDELDYGLKLADTLSRAGHGPEALAVLSKLHERPEGKDPRIDLSEAVVAWRLGDLPRMDRAAAVAVTSGRRLGTGLLVAAGLLDRAYYALVEGRPREAIEMLRQSEELAFRSGDRFTAGRADANLGMALRQEGDLDGSEQAHQRALANARELGTALGISNELMSLGKLRQDRGALPEARILLEQAQSLFHQIDYRGPGVHAGVDLAAVHLATGDPEMARHLLDESLTESRSTRIIDGEIAALQGLSELQSHVEGLEEALRLQESALQRLVRLRRPALAARALAWSAELLARTGDPTLAHRRLTQAEAAGRRAADRLVATHLLGVKARFALRDGKIAAARQASEEQLRLAREMRARPLETTALQGLAGAAQASGDLPRARDLLHQAQALAAASGDLLTGTELSFDLARLELAAGAPDASLQLAREAADWYHARHFAADETAALALVAAAQRRLGPSAGTLPTR